MEYVFAFEYCSCIYEAGFSVISIHKSRGTAYKAMRSFWVNHYRDEMTRGHNESKEWRKYMIDRNPLLSERCRIQKIELKD